jgi:5-amino-6-(5-phosphoribosylamino)uracil reductase
MPEQVPEQVPQRPQVTAVMAMSVDGKLADHTRSAGRFGSKSDQDHLELRVAEADAVIFGAGTLRAYGTTMPVQRPDLIADRVTRGQAAQPIQIVCSGSGDLDPDCHFFTQAIPRWLLTTTAGAKDWAAPQFDRVWAVGETINWSIVLAELGRSGITKLALLGGGQLVGNFFIAGLVDELWLTVCPLVLGGATAPTPVQVPVQVPGWREANAPRLTLIELTAVADEVFLHYQVK